MDKDKYINATHLMENIDAAITRSTGRGNAKSTEDMMMRATLGVLKQIVQDEVQTGEVRPVVHAHWVEKYGLWYCSECFTRSREKEDSYWNNGKNPVFCAYCGATMDEPDQEERM